MLLELYQGYSIGFYGHRYGIINLSNSKYALFSGKYNRFLDFELVNYGFAKKWIYSIHPNGISKRDNFLCYETEKDLKEFIIKLIIKLIEHREEYNIQVCVPNGQGRILSMLKSKGIGYIKRDGDYYLTIGGGNSVIYEDENYISSENYSCDDNTSDVLNITINRRHKLNIDFKE